jgi:hypothetical protein
MDRALFGDNQFFGVNHLSEEKARTQAIRFQRDEAIIEVLDAALVEGINTFMCTTHERIAAVCQHWRSHPQKYRNYKFYPCMPYAHKYANAAAEYGLIEAVRRFLPEEGLLNAIVRGGVSLAKKDVEGLATLLIDAEMKMFQGLNTPVIFLQNVVTDLLLGIGFKEGLRIFADHVRLRYNAEPGFITMNLIRLLDSLDELKLKNPIVCCSINKAGFRMCGGKAAYEQAIAERQFRPVAMSVFASGAIHAKDALEYILKQKRIEAIVFGASTREHIRQTKSLIDAFS